MPDLDPYQTAAATRARDTLYVIPTVRAQELRMLEPSRFITEMTGTAAC